MTKEELLKKANGLPLEPGVYIMMNKAGKVIYVGKAKKLKNRVSQYFQDTSSHNEKTRSMVSQVDHFDTIFVRSEFEALILENSLIKRHQPHYNILLKDDKGYPFVRLSVKDPYPRFSLASKAADDGARYFGPFGGRSETRAAIDAVLNALKLPTCSRVFPRDIGKDRPCLNHHIGRCDGFCCEGGPSQEEYLRRIDTACHLFEGKLRQLSKDTETEMLAAAENLEFEKAATLRDRRKAFDLLLKNQNVIASCCADTDVWGIYPGAARCGCCVLHVEQGNLLGREIRVFSSPDDDRSEVLSAVLSQYYLEKQLLPHEILVPVLWEDADTFAELLSQRCGHKVMLRLPKRGERVDLLELSEKNAREEVEKITTDSERINKTLENLQEIASLPQLPHRMESYDISNTGSSDMVASMVVFVDGKPLKRDYRRFEIKTLTHPDDYAAMQEVLERRLKRYLEGDEKFSPLPDLLLIDGGEMHARSVQEVVDRLHLDIPILGMVKDDRHRTRALQTPDGREIGIQNNQPLYTMLGRIQEEVHRFAITYHHQKHMKSAYKSQLDGIPGIGEVRKKALLKRFGSIHSISLASVEQLQEVLTKPAAHSVYEWFHHNT